MNRKGRGPSGFEPGQLLYELCEDYGPHPYGFSERRFLGEANRYLRLVRVHGGVGVSGTIKVLKGSPEHRRPHPSRARTMEAHIEGLVRQRGDALRKADRLLEEIGEAEAHLGRMMHDQATPRP